MRDYEMMVVLHPTITDEQMPAALERIGGIITAQGGEGGPPATDPPWGRRRLAYPIDDQRDGYYALYRFALDPARSSEVDRALKLDDDVLRYLIVRPEVEQPTPAAAESEQG